MLDHISSQLVVAHFYLQAPRFIKEVDLALQIVSAIGVGPLQDKIVLGRVFHRCGEHRAHEVIRGILCHGSSIWLFFLFSKYFAILLSFERN